MTHNLMKKILLEIKNTKKMFVEGSDGWSEARLIVKREFLYWKFLQTLIKKIVCNINQKNI